MNSDFKNKNHNLSHKDLLEKNKTENSKSDSQITGIQNLNYKTKQCRHFELGKCKLSGLCNFAHGKDELSYYQGLSKIDDKSLKTIESISQLRVETSVQKIEKMESLLDDFYHKQNQSLQLLKELSKGIKSGAFRNEENISKMESHIISLYNSAVMYTQEIGKTMEIVNFPAKRWEHPEFYPFSQPHTLQNQNQVFSETFDECNEEQLELVKKRLYLILTKLQTLPWSSKNEFNQRISKAQTAFDNNQLLEASKLVQLVLYDKNLDPFLAGLCRNILNETMTLIL